MRETITLLILRLIGTDDRIEAVYKDIELS